MMPMIIVVIVVVLWLVILVPSFMRRRSNSGGGIGSISHFHQQLRVLEQSAPQPIVAPAYRLRGVGGTGETKVITPGSDAPPVLTVVGADQLPRPALAFLGDGPAEGQPVSRDRTSEERSPGDPGPYCPMAEVTEVAEHRAAGGGHPWSDDVPRRGSWPPVPPVSVADPVVRQQVRRRRRDILAVLVGAVLVTAIIGFIPGASLAFVATAVLGTILVAYVALLVQLRRRAEEREAKLHYLTPAQARPAVTRVSGRYAHPSNQAVAAR
jgi:hypothetical protein